MNVSKIAHVNLTSRQIFLPTEAETGGYKGIWKKTLHLFHFLTHSGLGRQYDWVFKGDDDTFVNLPQMRRVLPEFDPDVPVVLGNNGYGVGCRGVAPTSPYYWQNKGTTPCHGGAGYAMSRGLLDIMAPHFLGCASEWPSSSYEDATMSFCLLRHAAVSCTGMKGDFGWDRYHNAKREMVASKLDALEKIPVTLGSALSFHPAPPQFQSRIHGILTKLRVERASEIEAGTAATLATTKKYLISQWNCTVGREPTSAGLQTGAAPFNALCQRYAIRKPPLADQPRDRSKKSWRVQSSWPKAAKKQGIGGNQSTDIILVAIPSGAIYGHGETRARSLLLLVKTLRATGCSAQVRVLGPCCRINPPFCRPQMLCA